MTKTKIAALIVLVVGTALYLYTVLYPPVSPWEKEYQAALAAYENKNYQEAEKHFQSSLVAAKKFSPDDPRLKQTLESLAEIFRIQSKYSQATVYLKRLVEISEENFGPDHSNVAARLNNLAGNFRTQRMLTEAAPLYKRSLEIWEKNLGPDNPLTLFALKNYVDILQDMGRDAEAEKYRSRLKENQSQTKE